MARIFSTSARVRTVLLILGPSSLVNSKSIPIFSSGNRMSAKRIAASSSKRRMGCRVISTASSGVLHTSMKLCLARTARYSSRYRPACLIIQTGVQSTLSLLHAFRYRSARDINDDLLNKLKGVYKPDRAKKIEIYCVMRLNLLDIQGRFSYPPAAWLSKRKG